MVLVIREIFKPGFCEKVTFFEIEKLPLFLKYFILKLIRLYLKINYVLLNAYYRFWICSCFRLRAFYWFAFHGLILLEDDD